MLTWPLEPNLNTSETAIQLANAVLEAVHAGEVVRLDFADVQVMTPSFANALVMTLLATTSIDDLRSKCDMANRSSHVIENMNLAVKRFQAGIRLSSQRTAAVA